MGKSESTPNSVAAGMLVAAVRIVSTSKLVGEHAQTKGGKGGVESWKERLVLDARKVW